VSSAVSSVKSINAMPSSILGFPSSAAHNLMNSLCLLPPWISTTAAAAAEHLYYYITTSS